MKNIQEIISDQQRLNQDRKQNNNELEDRNLFMRWIEIILDKTINRVLKASYKVELSNANEIERLIEDVSSAIDNIPEQIDTRGHLEDIINELNKLKLVVNVPETKIPDNKKDLQAIEKAVKGIKIPEVKIPEFPEIPKVDFTDLLEAIRGLEKSLVVQDTKKDMKTSAEVLSVLSKLEVGLSTINKSVNELDFNVEVPKIDLEPVIKASKETTKAINNLVFPVANFRAQEIIDAINDMDINVGDIEINTQQLEDKMDTLNGKVATETTLKTLQGLSIGEWDKVTQTQAELTDTWVFELASTPTKTVTVTYTAADKKIISTVELA